MQLGVVFPIGPGTSGQLASPPLLQKAHGNPTAHRFEKSGECSLADTRCIAFWRIMTAKDLATLS